MSAPATFSVELEVVTPIFMGGADQEGSAELRPSSLKGLLRYWYRTIDPDYARTEPALFGSAGALFGQAPFLIVVPGRLVGDVKWDADAHKRFAKRVGSVWRNGLTYLGFSLGGRRAIDVGTRIAVVHYLARRATHDDRILKGLCASWWLLCHIGGLGSRSRRGFGTVALRRWAVDPPGWPSGMPPLPYGSRDREGWWHAFEKGLKALRGWYPGASGSAPDHALLGGKAWFLLVRRAQARTWEEGLNEAGLLLQAYRQRRHDYPAVVEHLAHRAGRGGQLLRAAPKKSAFGLPLPFFSQSLRKAGARPFKTVFHGTEHGRSASRLWVRLVRADGAHHPMFARLSGPLLPAGEQIIDAEHLDAHGNPVSIWSAPGDAVLDGFLKGVAANEGANAQTLKGV